MAGERTSPAAGGSDRSLRRLRYFCALLSGAYRAAHEGGLHQDTLRASRLDLNIDIPELDVVTIWSTRPGDGSISIPYADFILAQILTAFEECSSNLTEKGTANQALEYKSALSEALKEISGGVDAKVCLPRLIDQSASVVVLTALCSDDGLLDRILALNDRRV